MFQQNGWLVSLSWLWVGSAIFGQPGSPDRVAWASQESPGSQEAVDLFSDVPEHALGFVRVAAWNVRHLQVGAGSVDFFPGADREAKAAVLTASFAKAIADLQIDLLILIEVQPREGEPDRLQQVRRWLIDADGRDWQSTMTHIEYDEPEDPYGNLQFGVLWNRSRGVVIDPQRTQLLEELRQPRSPSGELLHRVHRTPWLVPVRVETGSARLEFDLLALHLKSGGATPQAAEVDAIAGFIRGHQLAENSRHLMVCGDWNIRPDEDEQGRGRSRLQKLCVREGQRRGGDLMRLLTVGAIGPDLSEWAQLTDRVGDWRQFPAISQALPFSHVGAQPDDRNTLLDHLAISRTLDELFDHPVEVRLAGGRTDLRAGIEIVSPRVPFADYLHFTDHLPVVLTLPVHTLDPVRRQDRVRIVAVEPNPIGDETQHERILLKNATAAAVDLAGWWIEGSTGDRWVLDRADSHQVDGKLARGRSVTVFRRGRSMSLSNSGDRIALFAADGTLIDSMHFAAARTGQLIWNP